MSGDRSFAASPAATSGALAAHEADTTAIHGITDTAALVTTARQVIAGTGLTGGGTLAADRTLTVAYGSTSGTATEGNDSRVTGAAQKASNLSDLGSVSTARTNLGLHGAAVLDVGTTAGTVAAGDDTRIVAAVQTSRQVLAGSGLTGGGTLTADRTLSADLATTIPPAAGSVGAVGTGTTLARADHQHPTAAIGPEDYGFAAWNVPWWQAGTGTILTTAGTVYVQKIRIPTAMTVTNLLIFLGTAGATLTTGQNFAGLYNASKALLAATGDQSTAWQTSGLKTMALAPAQAVTAGYYYVAFYANGTTLPSLCRGSSNSIVNAGLSAANSLWATADTGRTTTLPDPLGTFAASSTAYAVAVS